MLIFAAFMLTPAALPLEQDRPPNNAATYFFRTPCDNGLTRHGFAVKLMLRINIA